MKVLWLLPESMNMEPCVATLPGEQFFYMRGCDAFPLEAIKQMVECTTPELIIYIGVSDGPFFPTADMIRALSWKSKIILFNCDAGCPGWAKGIKHYQENKCFDFIVNIDGNSQWERTHRDLTLWCPLDPSFYNHHVPKTVKFGWAGGLGSSDRQIMMRELGDHIAIMPRNESWGSYQQYANFLLSCRITLNMARSGSGLTLQRKNRVTEAGYAGCLLLEERGAPTSEWFELGLDYLDYGSSDEVIAIVNSLEPSDIDTMATRFQQKVLRLYSPHLFWEKIFANL